ncbi:hypothetical protein [Streptomyces sp. GZWMJZ-114]|uniref:hypothetical protein n=1 Tax=Streptomyces sp. GZWMJZ-114 TaxID=2494734 RepID=UPI0010111CB4|nr:hypothetical protein [Streptomyces sp. GZWMJZ-114]
MAVDTHWRITHRCGHATTHDLSRKPADARAAFDRWLATTACTVCWRADRGQDRESTEQWRTRKRAEEQQAATDWAAKFDMPPLEGSEKAVAWGERCRHQLMDAAHTALVVEGSWDEEDWLALEEKARSVRRAGWWIDQRDADGSDLVELLDAATDIDKGNENPFY